MAVIAPPKPTDLKDTTEGRGGGFDQEDTGGSGGERRQPSDRRYYTGMLLGLGAVVMLFAALTSAYVVRKGVSDDWQAIPLPIAVWVNSLVLVASSLTLEKARRCLGSRVQFQRWWLVTLMLGMAFFSGQLLAWHELARRGVYLATNPASSFFYVLTATHGVHLFGGVVALLAIFLRARHAPPGPSRTAVQVTALYWHFLDGLWIYLLLLLVFGGNVWLTQ